MIDLQINEYAAPGLDVIEYQKQTFKAGFGHQNDFKGSPSPAIDAAWSNLTKG